VTTTASRFVSRAALLQALFSTVAAAIVAAVAPFFLLLTGQGSLLGALSLGAGVFSGGLVSALLSVVWLRRHRYLLRALALGSRAVDTYELYEFSDEPRRLIVAWLSLSAASALLTVPLRPAGIDFTTAVTLSLLGIVMVSTAALPLFMFLRAATARALELAPPDVMREVVEDADHFGRIGRRVSRRMVFAVVTPVVFLTIGAALIVSAQLRRADERNREETARALARAVLEQGRGEQRGVDRALARATVLGFSAYLREYPADYDVSRGKEGFVVVTTPLDAGSATVSFGGSKVGVLSSSALIVALLAIGVATGLGTLLGRALGKDLRAATRDISEIGTEAVAGRGARLRGGRFRAVAELGNSVAELALRFRVFARAQERAITSREAAARMRGLFFASVSHDLKSPLNAILGFTELVRKNEPITAGQAESLGLIERRGRELLALIETILDAARVEAGQLTLVRELVRLDALMEEALQKARDLGGSAEVSVHFELATELPRLRVDRLRMSRALATFIAHALGATEEASLRASARVEKDALVLEIEVPSSRFNARQVAALLDPSREPGTTEHRGLALGLRLGRSIVELHRGKIEVQQRGHSGAFVVSLPVG
jgi:signal transduction histidine kinase